NMPDPSRVAATGLAIHRARQMTISRQNGYKHQKRLWPSLSTEFPHTLSRIAAVGLGLGEGLVWVNIA
ncbi:MAG: hypothetical protein ABJG55_01075, partial [Paracoccaceae bacterium]